MIRVRGVIILGNGWLQSRTRGGVISELISRFWPRYAPVQPGGPPSPSAITGAAELTVQLNWSNFPGTVNPTQTEIWVSDDDVSYTLLDTVPLTTLQYIHNVGISGALRYYQLRHVNITDNSAFSATVSATARLDGPDAPPTNLQAATKPRVPGENGADLTWTNGDVTANTIVEYKLAANSTWLRGNTYGPGVSSGEVTGLTANSLYNVRVLHEKNTVELGFSQAAFTTLVDGPNAGPTGLTAVAEVAERIELDWTNGDSTALTRVLVSTDDVSYSTLVTLGSGVSSYTHVLGAGGLLRYYRVEHTKNGITFGGQSNTASDTSFAAHSGLAATTPGRPAGETELDYSFTTGAGAAGEVTTIQYREQGTTPWLTFGTIGAGLNSGTITGLDFNTIYEVRVTHGAGLSPTPSNVSSAATLTDGPNAGPTTLVASTGALPTDIDVTWANGDASASSRLYVSTDNVSFSVLTTLSPGVTSYSHDLPDGGLQRWYKVEHIKNGVVFGGFSNTDDAVSAANVPAGAPTLTNISTNVSDQFVLTINPADNYSDIEIYVALNDGAESLVTTLPPETTSYTSVTYPDDTKAQYRARHIVSGNPSTYSNQLTDFIPDPIDGAPVIISATPTGYGEADFVWTNGDAESSIQLQIEYNSLFTTRVTLPAGTTSYSISGLEESSETYRVRLRHTKTDAEGTSYVGDFSNIETFTTDTIPAPSGVDATHDGFQNQNAGQYDVSWTNTDASLQSRIRFFDNGGVLRATRTVAPGVSQTLDWDLSTWLTAGETGIEFRVDHFRVNGLAATEYGAAATTGLFTHESGPAANVLPLASSYADGDITFNWDLNGAEAALMSVSGPSGQVVATRLETGTSYVYSIAEGGLHTITLRAVANGYQFASTVTINVTAELARPGTPNVSVNGSDQFVLNWTNTDTAPVEVWQRINSGAEVLVATLGEGVTTYTTPSGYSPNTQGRFRLRYNDGTIVSAYSFQGQDWVPDPLDGDPTGLVANGTGYATGSLSWTNGDPDATTQIWIDEGSGYVLETTVSAGVTSYNFTNLPFADTNYPVRIRHLKTDSGGTSYTGNYVLGSFNTDAIPAPTGISATPDSDIFSNAGRYTLLWTQGDTALTHEVELIDGQANTVSTTTAGVTNSVSLTNTNMLASEAGCSARVRHRYAAPGGGFQYSAWNTTSFTHEAGPPAISDNGSTVDLANNELDLVFQQNPGFQGLEWYVDPPVSANSTPIQQTAGTANFATTDGDGTYTVFVRGWANGFVTAYTSFDLVVLTAPAGPPSAVTVEQTELLCDFPPDFTFQLYCAFTSGDATAETEIYISINGGSFTLWDTASAGQSTSFFFEADQNTNPTALDDVQFRCRHKKGSQFSGFAFSSTVTLEDPCEGGGGGGT